jgi:hypothetical protein
MSTDATAQAHAVVAAIGDGRWRLDRGEVVDRLHELVANPDLIRQGRTNLCGAASLMTVWLRRDPVSAVTYAAQLFQEGRSRIGVMPVRPSRRLIQTPFGRTERQRSCASADWMLMAGLRDSANHLLPYRHAPRLAEAAAAITTPRVLRRWLVATGLYRAVRDETSLVLRRPMRHAEGLAPSAVRDVFLLVAMEMFRAPPSRLRRALDRMASLMPNHWVIGREPVRTDDVGDLVVRFWSWGAEYRAVLARPAFARCYYGALVADVAETSGRELGAVSE